jgi:hypothetical protein
MTEPATTDHPVKSRASKKAAATVDAVDNVSVTEAEAPAENVITAPTRKASRGPSITSNDAGVIGSPQADRVFAKVVEEEEPKEDLNKVAVWSDKNVRWSGVGALVKGYNIVTKEAAEKWLSRGGIREATPEEVATHYGK